MPLYRLFWWIKTRIIIHNRYCNKLKFHRQSQSNYPKLTWNKRLSKCYLIHQTNIYNLVKLSKIVKLNNNQKMLICKKSKSTKIRMRHHYLKLQNKMKTMTFTNPFSYRMIHHNRNRKLSSKISSKISWIKDNKAQLSRRTSLLLKRYKMQSAIIRFKSVSANKNNRFLQ